MATMETGRTAGPFRSRAGPLCRMVTQETEALAAQYERFRDAWDRRDLSNAFIAFERFRENLLKHMRWEEASLFEEWQKHARPAETMEMGRHRAQHLVGDRLSARVEQLLGRRMGLGPDVDDELVIAIYELENVLASHRRAELHEVCCRLDALLSDAEILRIEETLHAPGPIAGR